MSLRSALTAAAHLAAILAAPAQDNDPQRTTVATHYFYWYRHPGEHFGGPGREGHLHAFVAPDEVSYESAAWHRREFTDMAAVGIDVALPVYWGFPGCEDHASVRFSNRGIPAMVEALDAMAAAREPRPRLGLFYDTTTLRNAVRGVAPLDGRADLTSAAGRSLFCDTVLGFFAQVPEPHWARHRGRPLVVLYGSGFAARWGEDLSEDLRAAFARRFAGERPFVVADVSWGEIGQDATTQWGAALAGPLIHGAVAQIGPGYDDSPVPGRRTPVRPREDGAFYRHAWRTAIAAQPELVLIETWNEMHEGTEVCRTVETGDSYLRLTADGVARLRRGEPGPQVALAHRTPLPRPDLSWGAEAKGASVVSWNPGDVRGLRPIAWEDGPIDAGEDALRASCPDGRLVGYVYFQVSDHWEFDGDEDLTLAIRANRQGDELVVEYDSRDRHAALDGAYTQCRAVAVTEKGERSEFPLRGARLANRQNGGADLRLVLRGGAVEVFEVALRRRRGAR
jgi:hypothetical protein